MRKNFFNWKNKMDHGTAATIGFLCVPIIGGSVLFCTLMVLCSDFWVGIILVSIWTIWICLTLHFCSINMFPSLYEDNKGE